MKASKALGFAMACASAAVLTAALAHGPAAAHAKDMVVDRSLVGTDYTWIQAGKKLYCWHYSINDDGKPYGTMDRFKKTRIHLHHVDDLVSLNPDKMTAKLKYEHVGEAGGKKYADSVITYKFKKYGTAKVSYMYGTYGDDPYEVTETHRYYKYRNPLKTFKVGSKNYAKKFKSQPFYRIKPAKIKAKVKVKAKKGWKVVEIRKILGGEWYFNVGWLKTVKNGSKVSINNNSYKASRKAVLEVVCYNKAKKYYESVNLFPGRLVYEALFG